MSVYRRFYGHRFPSLITTNVANRTPIFSQSDAAATLVRALAEAQEELRLRLYAWVIMPDHVHLVLEVPDGVRSGMAMRLIKARFARRWNHRIGEGESIWQTRFHERVLTSERALFAAVEYVHANPVMAGLADSAADYALSSAKAWRERSQAERSSYERSAELLKEVLMRTSARPAPA